MNRIKFTVQKRILAVTLIIFVGKFVAYFLTNSVGILTDALESIVNVITGFISLYSINVALKPRDVNHPYGHGKIESLSASVEGFLIIAAGLLIIYEGFQRLFIKAEIQQLDIGIVIIAVAGIMNYLLGFYSIKVGRKHNSIALVSGGKHLQSDTYSTIGLVAGLILLYVTNISWIDSALALLFGSIITYTGFKILKETSSNLMDEADFLIIGKLTKILSENKTEKWIDIHNLTLIKYGDCHHIDCDLILPWYINIAEAQRETEILKKVIETEYSEFIDLTVHADACYAEICTQCKIENCNVRKHEFQTEINWTIDTITKKNYQKHQNIFKK